MKEPEKKELRPCLVSGLFYPSDKEELAALLDKKLKAFKPGSSGLILSPHGSFSTCGDTLAAAYASCRENTPSTVLLLGPVHREKNHPYLFLPEKDYFETPLGAAPVDRKLKKELLASSPLFKEDDMPHMEEHCLEVQLPYIKHLFPEARILPVLMGVMNRKQIRQAAATLKEVCHKTPDQTLTILTVNLSDFLPLEKSREAAHNLTGMLNFPLEHSLFDEEKKETISTCGSGVLTLASEIFPRAGKAELLYQQHSRVDDHGTGKGVYYGAFSWQPFC